ncbi:cell division protein FtsQ [Streptomyces umbrinus]|uniref:cell division protein FtsQ/DivIB n=1 Tax=Streptomyces umbrinus TaxID=67370 RepID=UPI00167DB453|nr:FtsQ-type POTRA domain-containing protein [Streptomyces umbrinus]MCR3728039.1 cell division protein FtsQ [Streptomyces umbrinus]GHH54005.1 cell division protein FtsQ [Streptomyces umbrinus]
MAGPTTAERGERHARQDPDSGPPRPPLLKRLPKPRKLIIPAVCLALLAAGSLWVLYGSQWLRVERVSASGTRVLTPDQVVEAADVPVGSPLISVDTDVIEDRLRRKLPRIDSVDVVRSWPHGIGLKVIERTPVLIAEKGGKLIEVDAKGVRYATVSRAPKGVPALELTVSRSAGLRRFGTDRLMREAVRVAGSLPAAVARDTRVVKVRSYDSISLELSGNRTVLWGSGEKSGVKARTLSALMKAAPEARHFDVSVPTAPASSGS